MPLYYVPELKLYFAFVVAERYRAYCTAEPPSSECYFRKLLMVCFNDLNDVFYLTFWLFSYVLFTVLDFSLLSS